MKTMRLFTIAAVASLVACTDSPNTALTGPADESQPVLPTQAIYTIAGRISVSGPEGYRVIELGDADGNVYLLVGKEAGALASLDGGDVVARGTFDANPGFVVQDFTVTAMDGRPALDGVLEVTDAGFALRMKDGSLRVIPGLPSGCAELVGARIWVVGFEGPSAEFGRIGYAS